MALRRLLFLAVVTGHAWLSRSAFLGDDPDTFARMGSVGVAVAVVFLAASRPGGRGHGPETLGWIERRLAHHELIFHRPEQLTRPETWEAQTELARDIERIRAGRAEHSAASQRARQAFHWAAVGLLVASVLQLGLGDLMVCGWHGAPWGTCPE